MKNVTMKKIVVFGAGRIAETAYYYLTNDSDYEIVAFTVDGAFITKDEVLGLPVVPFEEIINKYPPSEFAMFVAVGYQNLNQFRALKYTEAKEKGYSLVSYISSRTSNVGNAPVGDNCFILEHQAIQPCCRIGNNVTIWSGNHIGHHSEIKDHCFLTSHIVISGGTVIEPYCFIGVNATIGHTITIGAKSIIGAGAIITKSTKEKSVYIARDTEPFRLDSTMFLRLSSL